MALVALVLLVAVEVNCSAMLCGLLCSALSVSSALVCRKQYQALLINMTAIIYLCHRKGGKMGDPVKLQLFSCSA